MSSYSQQPLEEEFELPLLPYAEYPLPQVIADLDFSDWSDDSDYFDNHQNYILDSTIAFYCSLAVTLILINLHIKSILESHDVSKSYHPWRQVY